MAPARLRFGPRAVAALLHRLTFVGIRLRPLIETQEAVRPIDDPPALAPFTFRELTAADIDALDALGSEANREEMLGWFAAGKRCYGLLDGTRVVANTWCDFDEVNFAPVRRHLAPDETYLFAAYTDPTYRGRDLAPRLRIATYGRMRELGRTRVVSFSEPFNLGSRRFKQKLGAVEVGRCVHVDLFGKWSRTFGLSGRHPTKKREAGL